VNDTPTTGPADSENLLALIRQQCVQEIADLRTAAAERVERIRAAAAAESATLEAEARTLGEQRGRDAAAKRLAAAETDSRRAWLWAREHLIEELLDAARQRLAAFPDVADGTRILQALIRESLHVLPPGAACVRVSPGCAARLDRAACDELGGGSWQLTVTSDGAPAGGVIVESDDGRLCFDNSFEARMGRGRDRLRQVVLDTLGAGEMPEGDGNAIPMQPGVRGSASAATPATVDEHAGVVIAVNGPVVGGRMRRPIGMSELVWVGTDRLVGEVIGLREADITVQVYEDTTGLKPGDPVEGSGLPLFVELGPGLLGGIFDGVQRPLEFLAARTGDYIRRGTAADPLDRTRRWPFTPAVEQGTAVQGGEVLGTVPETASIEHRVLVPPDVSGTVTWIAAAGAYTLDETIAVVEADDRRQVLRLYQRWPVRRRRPYGERRAPSKPLLTGQRIIDAFFPLARGGTAAIPGGFGTGKTVTEQTLAKWAHAHVIVYIGCGERGNEMTGVLSELPQLEDPRTGRPLLERTVLVANTSNMPVAAREASIYTGITIAEYYRDMGYDVAVLADSTSRWAEALREISGRLEEMPAEEGFPAYLATRLADFYERAGSVTTLGGREGSVSVIGAVSPPGGDFTEPVTQHTKRFVRCFWGLDKELASARFFPAINFTDSYSEYAADVSEWWRTQGFTDWLTLRTRAVELLHEEVKVQQIARLVGEESLPDRERMVLEGAWVLRNAFLQQNAFDRVDRYSTPEKQLRMLRVLFHYIDRGMAIVERKIPIYRIKELPARADLMRMRFEIADTELERFDALAAAVSAQMDALAQE
jgi:V/A-type H+/Na+-transporting ATPase subunit A